LARSAAIYGANSAGKSNLIDAIRVFQQIVRESSRKISINDKLELVPFRLSTQKLKISPPNLKLTLL
jgi:AAA15 family ATPase/GTPase